MACKDVTERADVVTCITTGGAPTTTPAERIVALKASKPELASIYMASINFGLFHLIDKARVYSFDWELEYLEKSKDNIFKNTFYDHDRIFKICVITGLSQSWSDMMQVIFTIRPIG